VFRDLDSSPALTFTINKKLDKLSRFSSEILRSRVVLDSPHKSKNKGKLYRASIELNLKGKPITVSHDAASAHLAVKEAFSAAERRLKEARHLQIGR
jgi:ribosomal subunit interface protein